MPAYSTVGAGQAASTAVLSRRPLAIAVAVLGTAALTLAVAAGAWAFTQSGGTQHASEQATYSAQPAAASSESADSTQKAAGTSAKQASAKSAKSAKKASKKKQAVDTDCELSAAARKSEFVLYDSDKRLYSTAELKKLSTRDLCIARNEIYARYHRPFKMAMLRKHFNSTSWYTEDPSLKEGDIELSEIENENAERMKKIERARGSKYLSERG